MHASCSACCVLSTSGSLISIAATGDHIILGDSICNGNSINDDGVVFDCFRFCFVGI
jgi:hypothetical protein